MNILEQNLIYTFDPYEDRPWKEAVLQMYRDGVRIFSFLLPLPLAWREDGSYDFALLDGLHREIIALAPEAKLLPRVFLTTPDWWDERYPDELLKFSGPVPEIERFEHEHQKLWRYETKMYHSTRNASIASLQWRTDAGEALAAYVRFCHLQYPKRFIGFMPAYGTCGEWGTFGSYKNGRFGNADFSRPAVSAFRAFLKARYHRDFPDAMPPGKPELLATETGCLRSPASYRHVLDYTECMAQLKAGAIDHFCGIVKRNSPGGVLAGVFGGAMMSFGSSAYMAHHTSAGFSFDELTHAENVDFLSTPNSYFNRRNGIFSQGPVTSLAKHKIFIAECDARTHLATDGYGAADETEAFNQFLFETGYNLCTGNGLFWWYDFGRGWYQTEQYSQCVRKLAQEVKKHRRGNDGVPARIAVVVSSKNCGISEGMGGYYRMFNRMLNEDLPACGAPYDLITADDLFELPPYRLYIFRDMFYADEELRTKLRRFFREHDASCVWFYAAGCITDNKINTKDAASLTNIPVKMLPQTITSNSITLLNAGHALCGGLDVPQALNGVEQLITVWSPVIYADTADFIGQIESVELPGMVCRQDGNRFDFWAAAPQIPPQMLRNLAEAAGVELLVSPGVQMFGTAQLVTLRNLTGRPVRFKTDVPLRDILTDRLFAPANGEVTLPSAKGETMILSRIF